MKKCTKCGVEKPLDEFYSRNNRKTAQCKECVKKRVSEYKKEHEEEIKKYQKENRYKRKEYHKEYYKEHNDKIKETQRLWHQKHGGQSMQENKDCSQYLGIYVGERLCRHLFKDVEVMPNNNRGYDIVCNRGKLIDVKTSCIRSRKGKNPHWRFAIKRNKICDFFILIALDNRTDLNPLHMWMVPANNINDKIGVSISTSTIYKWDEWKRDIDDVEICCTKMKNGSVV